MNEPPSTVARLAQAADVAVRYRAGGRIVVPPERTLRAVLGALGHSCEDEPAVRRSLRALRRRSWMRPIDPVVACWQDSRTPTRVTLSASDRGPCETTLTLEDGTRHELPPPVWGGVRTLHDDTRRRGTIELPAGLPLGYHRLTITDRGQVGVCTVIVAPPTCPDLGSRRRWGWTLQTYALRSTASWGQGEFRDLGALASWSAAQGADFVLTNPVHAVAPTLPQQPSPYSPTSRRFVNPCYLHVPDLLEFDGLPVHEQQELRRLPPELATDTDRIDRDRVWDTKRAVLQRLFATMGADRREQLARYRHERGVSLERFARFCALAEVHGLPFDEWPAGLRDPRSAEVDRWAADHADRVALYAWLQLLCEQQLASAQERARQAGMSIGIIHDLAVSIDPAGADAWSLPDELARDMSLGAPPDAFNQHGQNWAQPPLLPEAQRANGYQTLREVLRASMRLGGGLRIDHILGLSRLFWIPQGAGPADGTYVRYPADEQFAVLALEAHRADAIVVGEDLGTIDDRIRRLMRRRGVASTTVLYFEREGEGERERAGGRGPEGEGERERAGGRGPEGEGERERAGGRGPEVPHIRPVMASVTTHDLPTATGFWDGSAFDLRAQLDLLTGSVADERRWFEEQQRALLQLLLAHGCLENPDADVRTRVLAMHRFLAASPAALATGALWDAVGDPRQPNVPGTVESYPNWRLPLARPTPSGLEPVTLEAIMRSAAVRETMDALRR